MKDVMNPQIEQMASMVHIAMRTEPLSKIRRYWQSKLSLRRAVDNAYVAFAT